MTIEETDPDWVITIGKKFLDRTIKDLSENQKKILRDQYLESLKEGMKPKEAIEKALQIVMGFNN
jgi:hypothetical protein